MRKFTVICAAFLLALTLGSCGGGDSTTSGVDPAVEVVAFREAVPDSMTLSQVLVPGSSNGRMVAAVGDAAIYPPFVVPVATQINDMVGLVVAALQAVVQLPYSEFDEADDSFYWGPIPNEDGTAGAMVLGVTREVGIGDDPDSYVYILFRVPTGFDLKAAIASEATPTDVYPLLIGFSVPEGPDGSQGSLLLDFDADAAASVALGDAGSWAEGKFAAAFGQSYDAVEETTLTFNMAVFRGFKDAGVLDPPINIDYLYGGVVHSGGTTVDYVNFLTEGDVITSGPEDETLSVRMAFINQGFGRAEVSLSGGNVIGTNEVVECWDDQILQTYIWLSDGVNIPYAEPFGSVGAECGFFSDDLDSLSMPEITNPVVADIFAALDDLAVDGVDAIFEDPAAARMAPLNFNAAF